MNNNSSKFFKIIGLIGSIASIIALSIYFITKDSNESLQLTVFVSDDKGNVIVENEGELIVDFGNDRRVQMIGENGRTNFGEIPKIFKDSIITIGFKVEGYRIKDMKNKFKFSGNPIHLKVVQDNSLGIIKGVVTNNNSQLYIKRAAIRINNDTIIYTDNNGIFKIILPLQMRVKTETERYRLTISKKGYRRRSEFYSPNSSDAEIRLENE